MGANLSIFNFDNHSSMIKKLILNIGLVILVVFILDFAIGKTLRHFYFKETSGFHYRTTYSIDSTKAAILIFGSSSANHHYEPRAFEDTFGVSFYNTGRDGNGIFYQTALLKSVLHRYTPQIIVLDYSGDFSNGRKEYDKSSSLLPYYQQHSEVKEEVELRGPFEKIKLWSQIYPFNSQVLTIAIGNMEANKNREPDIKGYVPMKTVRPPQMQVDTTDKIYEPDPNKVNAFKEFVGMAKKSGADFFVICSPRFQKLARYQEVDICKQICAEEKVPFWDFSRDTFFLNRQDLFYDTKHLNEDGSKLFSNLIANKIHSFKLNQQKN